MEITEQQLSVLIDQAKRVAQAAHMGQKRKSGEDYFSNHVQAVADAVEDRLKPIAFLHDVAEDTPITLEDLREVGFPEYVIDAVDLLTHKNSEPNVLYWGRIAKNKDAALVKIADIKHNISVNPNKKQLEKYQKGLKLFADAGYDVE